MGVYMSISKTAVFISSRFEEFKELRKNLFDKISNYPKLDLTPVDLNNERVGYRPPIDECLLNVRRSEFMILLIGDSYGDFAHGFNKSFTQLEYEEAAKDTSNTKVLVFFIGNLYNIEHKKIIESGNNIFDKWRRQLLNNHVVGFLDCEKSGEDPSEIVFDRLKEAFYDVHFGKLSVEENDEDLQFIESDIEGDISDIKEEAETLSQKNAQKTGKSIIEQNYYDNELNALLNPTSVAALEQRNEAELAIETKEYAAAIKHLKKAIDLRPLDYISNYMLASLYIALGKKDKYSDIIDLSTRAAKLALYYNDDIRASLSYQFASRGYQLKEDFDNAMEYADLAIKTAPNYSRGYLEKARVYIGRKNNASALQSVETAFRHHYSALVQAFKDPVFKNIKKELKKHVESIIVKNKKSAKDISDLYKEIKERLRDFSPIHEDNINETASLRDENNNNIVLDINKIKNNKEIKYYCEKIINSIMADIKKLNSETKEFYKQSIINIGDAFKNIPITTLNFEFKYEGDYIKIMEWLVKDGDIISAGDKLFTFSFKEKNIPLDYFYKGGKVKIYKIIHYDTIVKRYPEILEYVPVDYKIPVETPANKLNKEILYLNDKLKSIEPKYNALKTEVNHLAEKYNSMNFLMRFLFGNKDLLENKTTEFNDIESKRNQLRNILNEKEIEFKEINDDAKFAANIFMDFLTKFNSIVMDKSLSILPFRFFKYGYHLDFKYGDLAKIDCVAIKESDIEILNDFPDYLKNSDMFKEFDNLKNKLGYVIKENSKISISFFRPFL